MGGSRIFLVEEDESHLIESKRRHKRTVLESSHADDNKILGSILDEISEDVQSDCLSG